MALSGKVWENGDFSVGFVSEYKRLVKMQHCIKRRPLPSEERILMAIRAFGVEAVCEFIRTNPSLARELFPHLAAPIGSSMAANSHRRGLKGITSHGKKMVRNAALRLEREAGRGNLTFLTLTLPGVTSADCQSIAEAWPEICRVFFQKLSRMLKAKGLPGEFVSVTEVQEKRFAWSSDVALHLHVIFVGKGLNGAWAYAPIHYRHAWKSVLRNYLQDETYVESWDAVENVERVKHSAGAYLGKYMSKGAQVVNVLVSEGRQNELPKAWWNASLSLRRRVIAMQVNINETNQISFLFALQNAHERNWFPFLYPIVIPAELTGSIHVGWVGRINQELYDILANIPTEEAVNLCK